MTPLPFALDPGSTRLVAWRIDMAGYATTWDSGIGAERFGGRWNPKGVRAVYCSLDPATCLVEAAVHKGFATLDSVAHVLTCCEIGAVSRTFVVEPHQLPNPAWLHGGIPSAGQQAFGAAVLSAHDFVLFPSAVSKESWNLVFDPTVASRKYRQVRQQALVVDTRLNPAR